MGRANDRDNRQLIEQLRRLERHRRRTGKDAIDHPTNGHDDLANAVAGACWRILNEGGRGAEGFSSLLHVAKEPLLPTHGPLYIGQTLTDIPATVIAEAEGDSVRVLAAFVTENASLKKHLEVTVKPWLARHRRYRLVGIYENISDGQAQANFAEIIEAAIPGEWQSVESPWEVRRESMFDLLGKAKPFAFEPALQITPNAKLLIEALSGHWRYEQDRRSYQHTIYWAVANAFSLVAARLIVPEVKHREIKIDTRFNLMEGFTSFKL